MVFKKCNYFSKLYDFLIFILHHLLFPVTSRSLQLIFGCSIWSRECPCVHAYCTCIIYGTCVCVCVSACVRSCVRSFVRTHTHITFIYSSVQTTRPFSFRVRSRQDPGSLRYNAFGSLFSPGCKAFGQRLPSAVSCHNKDG